MSKSELAQNQKFVLLRHKKENMMRFPTYRTT